MASKISKKSTLNILGVIEIDEEENKVSIQVEDVDDPMDLIELIKDFNGLETKITLSYGEDIV